jgi:hypothetical protein
MGAARGLDLGLPVGPAASPSSTRRRHIAAQSGLRKSAPASGARSPGSQTGAEVGHSFRNTSCRPRWRGHARKHRVPVFGVVDRRGQHLGQRQASVVAQHQHPGVEGAGIDRRQKAGARDDVEPFVSVMRHVAPGGATPVRTGPAACPRPRAGQGRNLTQRAVQMRLHHVQDETRRYGRIGRRAARLQHLHARLAGQPMGGRDHAEGAHQLGPGGECHGGSFLSLPFAPDVGQTARAAPSVADRTCQWKGATNAVFRRRRHAVRVAGDVIVSLPGSLGRRVFRVQGRNAERWLMARRPLCIAADRAYR